MAHNINENKMMYYGERPWHGLGVELNHPATAIEAIQAARLDYPIELRNIFVQHKEENGMLGHRVISYVKASVRADTQQVLGIVSPKYKIIQNTEAFSFFDSIIGEKLAMYHTAGALGDGERIWILAKLPNDIMVTKDDVVEKYLLLTNSHNGSSSLRMYYTPVRVLCQNTLNMTYTDARDGIAIRHIGDISTKVNEARRVLGLAVNYYTRFSNDAQALLKYQMNSKELDTYFSYVLRGEDSKLIRETTRFKNEKDILQGLFVSGKGNDRPEVRGSAWAGYNAATEYADHCRIIKNIEKDTSNRLKSIWFGSSAQMKTRAYQGILEIVKINNTN